MNSTEINNSLKINGMKILRKCYEMNPNSIKLIEEESKKRASKDARDNSILSGTKSDCRDRHAAKLINEHKSKAPGFNDIEISFQITPAMYKTFRNEKGWVERKVNRKSKVKQIKKPKPKAKNQNLTEEYKSVIYRQLEVAQDENETRFLLNLLAETIRDEINDK
jgi:hypothetical protein